MNIVNLFHKGGDIMWVIFIALVLETVIILERGLFFRLISFPFVKFEHILRKRLSDYKSFSQISLEFAYPSNENKLRKILWQIKNFFYKNSPFYKIGLEYVEYIDQPQKAREEAIQRQSTKLISQMERFIRILSTIANVVPLIGLLGTVTGLIKAFQKIASLGGTVDVNQLAGGIYEAMLTTAFGLIVAVPAYIAFDFFNRMTEKRIEYMNFTIQHFNEFYYQNKQKTKMDLAV